MMPLTPPSDQSDSFQSQVNELTAYVQQAVSTGTAIHETEAGIWQHILAIGRSALEFYLSLQGDGDVGETVELEHGESARRLPARQSRGYQSVFGSFRLERWVYGSRVGQRIECVPLDSRLQLPESKFSYLLQDWDQALAVENPYAQVNQTLERILGFSQSSDSLERMNRQMSESVSAFESARLAPPLATAGQLIVVSADGKGVPIRHPADSPTIAGHRPNRGPKPNRKKMATVGAIYTIEPRVRRPQDVLDSLFREPRHPNTAKAETIRPQAKRVKAQLNLEPTTQRSAASATDQIFAWLKAQVLQRQPTTPVPLVLVMDGQPSLWQAAHAALPTDTIEVLDLLHVTSRVWSVVALWQLPHFDDAISMVKAFVSLILQGQVKNVITTWRLLADLQGFHGKPAKLITSVCQYFENNLHRMHYQQYLAAGYPIASGVIEGACRHFVKDRMERAGMQWSLVGAQAMLEIRAVALNQDWTLFNSFRIQRESERLYPHRNRLNTILSPLFA
jgi:hypothetical protein